MFPDNNLLCVEKCLQKFRGLLGNRVGISELLCEIRSAELTTGEKQTNSRQLLALYVTKLPQRLL